MEPVSILVVDDNPEIREIIQILLQGEGFSIEQAKKWYGGASGPRGTGI